MCDATFALSQRGGHYFQCPSKIVHKQLSKKLSSFLSSTTITKIHHVALGYSDSFLLSYQALDGKDYLKHHNLPEDLVDFIYEKNAQGTPLRLLKNLRITLGPYNESWYGTDGRSWRWMNLPDDLIQSLQSRMKEGKWTDRPRLVALGADNNFLLITEKNAAVWDLSHYRTLAKMLEFSKTQERGIEEVHNVELHAYRFQSFLALSRNGTLLHENLPPHALTDIESIKFRVKKACEEATRWPKQRRESLFKDENWEPLRRRSSMRQNNESLKRNPSLQQRATLRREWSNKQREFDEKVNATGYKVKLSLSLNITPSGLTAGFSKILG